MEIRKNVSFYVLTLMLVFLFFHRFIIQTLGIPASSKYFLDLLNVILFMLALFNQKIKKASFIYSYLMCYIIMIITGMISFLLFGKLWNTPFINVLFDLRNVLRFPVFFISCYSILNQKKTEKLFQMFIGFHLVNCVYIVYQYFTLEVEKYWMRGDNLNGFFGTETGGNQFVNVLMIVTTIIVFDKFIKKEYSKKFTMFFSAVNLMIAVLIELKFYFVEFALIVLYFIAPYIKKPTHKQLMWGIVAVIAIPIVYSVLVQILYTIYPWMEGTMSITGMIENNISDEGYTGKGDFNRFNAISGVITKIFNGNIGYSLIGIGFGTANLNGKFAQDYEWTHYSWMSTSYMVIETGLVGFMGYSISLLMPFFLYCKKNIYKNLSRVGALFLIALMIYDEALRTDAAYMIFFLVSTGLIPKYDCTEEFYKCQRLITIK